MNDETYPSYRWDKVGFQRSRGFATTTMYHSDALKATAFVHMSKKGIDRWWMLDGRTDMVFKTFPDLMMHLKKDGGWPPADEKGAPLP